MQTEPRTEHKFSDRNTFISSNNCLSSSLSYKAVYLVEKKKTRIRFFSTTQWFFIFTSYSEFKSQEREKTKSYTHCMLVKNWISSKPQHKTKSLNPAFILRMTELLPKKHQWDEQTKAMCCVSVRWIEKIWTKRVYFLLALSFNVFSSEKVS